MDGGAQSARMDGTPQMRMWCADSLGTRAAQAASLGMVRRHMAVGARRCRYGWRLSAAVATRIGWTSA